MTISVRLNEKDSLLIRDYAKINNISVSEFIRQTVLEKIETEIDLQAYNKAMAAYQAQPETFTLDEAAKELGLE